MLKQRQHQPNTFDKNSSFALKGIAIILMMIHHNFRDASLFSAYNVSFYPFSEQAVVSFAYACKICVSLFAFITGYGLFLSYSKCETTPTKWVLRRYIKTFSGYWFVWILSAVICQLINRRTGVILFSNGPAQGIINAVIDFLGLHNLFLSPSINGTWWYMSAAAVFIIMIPVIYNYKENIFLILIGTFFFIRIFLRSNSYTGGNSVYAFLTPFIFGFIFAQYNIFNRIKNIGQGKLITQVYKVIAEIWLIILFYIMYSRLPLELFWEFHFGLFPMLIIVFCVEYILPLRQLNYILVFLGKHSMNVFLVHTFIRAYYLRDLTYSWGHFLTISAFLLAVSICISIVIESFKRLLKYNYLIDRFIKRYLT